MTSKLAANDWCEIVLHDDKKVLELKWLPGEMSDGAFKASIALLAHHSELARAPFVLIDATQFHYKPGPGFMQWRDDAIIPRYGAAGTRKFAFHMPSGVPGTMESGGKEVIDGPAIFPTAWFSQRKNALEWFRKP